MTSRALPHLSLRSHDIGASARRRLLSGASAIALATLVAQGVDGAAARPLGRAGATAAPTVAVDAATNAAQEAASIARQSQSTMTRATQAIQAMQAAQAAARAAAAGAANPGIADGLSIGGAGKLPGLVVDPRVGTKPNLWINADLPKQSVADGKTTVTIKQNAAQAVMTWLYYNVSPDTSVVYDQQGNAGWVALNRIDATGAPSRILGQIKADGTVLLINPNGIVFGAGAQINLHSLVASSLDIDGTAAASAFNQSAAYDKLTFDIPGLGAVTAFAPPNESSANANFVGAGAGKGLFPIASRLGINVGNSTRFSMGSMDGVTAAQGAGGGAIVVENGASITTSVNSAGSGGYVALLGPRVANSGSVTTKNGQIILAAEGSVLLSEPQSTATGVHTALVVDQDFSAGVNPPNQTFEAPSLGGAGLAINDGLLLSPSGAVTVVGDRVEQRGVLAATTSVTRPGSLTLSASGDIIFAPGSITAILPDAESGAAPTSTATADYFKQSLQPQIKISGSGVDFQSGSLLRAPSAAVSIGGPAASVLLEDGATIDVSGLADVQVPISKYLVTFVVTPNEISDSPLAAALIGKTVTIDTRLSGTRADGVSWIGSPVVDASGYAGLVSKSIEEVLTVGGSVDVGGRYFIQQPGSIVNLSGGYVTFTGGAIATTRLVGADGRFYDIGTADPTIRYVGVAAAGGFTVTHSHWGTSETYTNPLLNRPHYEASYIAGASAGSLSLAAAPLLGGEIIAETVAGLRQRVNAIGGGAKQQTSLEQLPAGASLTITGGGNYLLQSSEDAGEDPFGLATFVFGSTDWQAPSTLSLLTDRLSQTGFGSITIKGADENQPRVNMATGAVLRVAPGGAVNLAGVETIDGSIIAPSGSLTLTGQIYSGGQVLDSAPPDLVIGSHAVLDVRGLWINDSGAVGDQLRGSAFVNGGSISIGTNLASLHRSLRLDDSDIVDATQSIIVSRGSVIDVSSGGYVGADGKLAAGSDGSPRGKGGSLSLLTYLGRWSAVDEFNDNFTEHPTGGNQPNAATVVLDGTIHSNGLGAGGTFSLQAPTITIDGRATSIASTRSGERSGEIVLPSRFFTDNGFADYSLTSVYGSSTVTAGTTVRLRQSNFLVSDGLASLPTGAILRDVATIGLLPDGLRNPVSFALRQNAYVFGETGPSTTAGVLLDAGARIVAEAGLAKQANVTLASLGGAVTVLGDIVAPGGHIELAATPSADSGTNRLRVTVGADATLDVSGVFVADPTQTAYHTGRALDGGTISLATNGVIDVKRGARLRLDGVQTNIEIPSGVLPFGRLVTQNMWSDGGRLTIDGLGSFAGSVSAHGGAPLASGGSLVIARPAIIEQPGAVLSPRSDALSIGVDTLNGSGFDSISMADASFVGSMSIHLRGSLILGGMLASLPSGGDGPSRVDLSAGYVWLRQSQADPTDPTPGDSALNISAKWIDIGNPGTHTGDAGTRVTFQNFGSVTLDSADAIRLIGSAVAATGNVYAGSLRVAGDLTLKAAEIYPSSGTSFTLAATGKIAVEQNGVARRPLSAGGKIILDAAEIAQNGTLWAPFGQIVLGNETTTQKVTLGAGSLTSVSGAGSLVPYGYTVDGERWLVGNTEFNGTDYNGFILTASPDKKITLNGASVATDAGARLDLSGGGDIYASEFVAGTGGSRNVLAGPNVYALVPTSADKIAAYDPTFAYSPTEASTGGTVFDSSLLSAKAGTAIYLSGGNGVPAGYYTLMPGMYATLPGAYRVTVASNSVRSAAPQSSVSADGSIYMTGNFANVITGARSSQSILLQLQPHSTWSRYSQIDITSGASFIRNHALTAGTAIPNLPVDGGALTFAARERLSIDGSFDFSAGSSPLAPSIAGIGGQLAISASKILVLASDKTASDTAGRLVIDADQISRTGATTVLIGGSSSVDASGRLVITSVATDVEIETDTAHKLTAPQLLVVTKSGGGGIIVDDGSAIAAVGVTANGGARDISIAGDGSLLRVASGAMVSVARTGATAQNGSILIGALAGTTTLVDSAATAGVTIDANALTIDSSGSNRLGANVALTASAFDLSAKIIDFGGDGASGGLALNDAVIGNFAGAASVRLRSASAINFYDANGLSIGDAAHPIGALILDAGGLYGASGATSVHASNIVLTNSGKASTTTNGLSGRNGRLTLVASDTITQSDGAVTANGFGAIDLQAGKAIRFAGKGSLTASNGNGVADVTLAAPDVVAAAGSVQALRTSGVLKMSATGAAGMIAATEIGGALSLTGSSIVDSGRLTALGGNLTLTATTGDILLADGALVNAAGSRITLGNVVQDTPGGTVKLVSPKGDVTIESGAKVSVAAAGAGYAGGLYIATAADGVTTLQGTLDGSAAFKDSGGTFALSTGRIMGDLPWGGFTRRFQAAIYQPGDLVVPTGVTLNSTEVLLVANQGSVIVDGTIDASSPTGGRIALYGAGVTTNGVTAGGVTINSTAKLLARYAAPSAGDPGYANGATRTKNGGEITLGVTGYWDGVSLNADGSEKVTPGGSGTIMVASGALIDVSAGTGGVGGSVALRAPVTTDETGARNVNVSFYKGASDVVVGAREVALNAYAAWNAADPATAGAGKHFDGIIDPAGWFNADGTKIAGTTDPTTGIFTPSGPVNADHVTFYQKTLLGFVNDPFGGDNAAVAANFGAGVRNLRLRPEIDLYNSSPNVNGGNITVASNWNFGAGTIDKSGAIDLTYRTTNGGEPGTLVLRATNNVRVNATITDGFFVLYDSGGAGATDAATLYNNELNSTVYQSYLAMFADGRLQYSAKGLNDLVGAVGSWEDFGLPGPADTAAASAGFFGISQTVFDQLQFALQKPTVIAGSAEVVDQYNQYYAQYVNMFRAYETEIIAVDTAGIDVLAAKNGFDIKGGAIVSYTDFASIISAVTGAVTIDPSTLVIPTAPTTSSAYYNIAAGLGRIDFADNGAATTTASDYVTQWAAYFFSVVNMNLVDNGASTLPQLLSNPTLSGAAGVDATQGLLAAVAVTPPFAPPAYTTLQPGYVSSATVNPPHPADTIANNPAIYSVGNVAVVNTTSAAGLMSASLGNSFSYDFIAGANFISSSKPSVDPNAVISLAEAVDPRAPVGSVVIDGHTSYSHTFSDLEIYVPTMVRTGTGSITLAAAGNVEFVDPIVQGAVYTAGAAAVTPSNFIAPTLMSAYLENPNGLVSTPAWGVGGGAVRVAAGGSIIGVASTTVSASWVDWLIHYGASDGDDTPFSGCAASGPACQTAAWVNYATFFQNFGALGGGDVTLRAGRDITDISASLPETLIVAGGFTNADPARAFYFGGGNLLVQAGGDLNSGAFLVGRGSGRLEVGGSARQTADNPITEATDAAPYPLLLAAQDGYISVVARGDLTLGTLLDPTTTRQSSVDVPSYIQSLTPARYLPGANGATNLLWGNGFTSYSAGAGLSLVSLAGDVNAMTLGVNDSGPVASSTLLPPSLAVAALQGNLAIGGGGRRMILAYPTDERGHDTGHLTLAAAGSINVDLELDTPSTAVIGAALNESNFVNALGVPSYTLAPTTFADSAPVLVSAGGDLDGVLAVNRPAQIRVGHDIGAEIFTFTGLNLTDADVTSIVAGRDIGGSYHLYGPGALLLEAGRNIRKPLNGADASIFSIYTIGDGSGGRLADGVVPTLHSYLPDRGASIYLLYGVANGVDYASATSLYVDPASAGKTGVDFLTFIAASLGQSRADAWSTFESLPTTRQHLLIDEAFLSFLTQVATDYRNPSSPYYAQYGRAYEAIGTLFPTSRGYANDGSGGGDPAAVGRLVMPYSLVETQAGGDINIIGPVGGIRVGSAGRDTLSPDKEGILTLRGGTIRIYTDQTVLVNQSRIMTQQGGNVEIFSANGDIDAGSGPKTYVSNPVLSNVCNYATGYCVVNPQGLVTGAGIGAVVSLPTQDPSLSNAVLSAPRGTVDAGAAGIRVGGNLTIVAQQINNAYNIQVQGSVSGLPTIAAAANVGALTSASSTAGAAAKAVETPSAGNAASDAPSIITVEIMGYGGSEQDAENAAGRGATAPAGDDEVKRDKARRGR